MADLVMNPGLILAMTYADIQADHKQDSNGSLPVQKGQFGIVIDRYGVRYCRYMHNKIGAVTKAGGLYTRAAMVSVANIDADSTTTVILAAAAFTADALVGRVLHVKTHPTAAGTAPEGESAIIASNTAGKLVLDGSRPLSVAPPVNTDIDVYSLFDFIASAAGDLNHNVFGVGLATNGISDGNWGVVQVHGLCPDVKCLSSAVITINKALIAGTEQVTVSSTSADNLLVGNAVVAGNSTNRGKILAWINVYSPVALTA